MAVGILLYSLLQLSFSPAGTAPSTTPMTTPSTAQMMTPLAAPRAACNEKIELLQCSFKESTSDDALDINDKRAIVRVAKEIAQVEGLVMLTFMNTAFQPFLANWMCHTKSMVRQSQILVIVTEQNIKNEIRTLYPKLNVVCLSNFKLINEKQKYCSAGFMRIGIYRTIVVNWMIQENIPVFLFELDAVWLQNPLPFLIDTEPYDLAIIPTYDKSFEAAIGFYYMRASKRMKQFWRELIRRLIDLKNMFSCLRNEDLVRERDNDQMVLHDMIKEHYKNIMIYFLPLDRFIDGKWYWNPDTRTLRDAFILNFNFIIGVDNKIIRAKNFEHWFVSDDNVTCLPHRYTRFRNQLTGLI
ncbi:uncharacterized protein LOC125673039 [Ostrea edulis]|uniref:uncharacterized protein LOC125673039 n=1 Tax=Ostrea edulis TaxID=37623 RepID=UPI0024AE922E|nr:uncharacterized protein LOC125673039 [Ostrea edulis]